MNNRILDELKEYYNDEIIDRVRYVIEMQLKSRPPAKPEA